MDKVELGRRVASARSRRNLTQEQLGSEVGLDRSAISRLESGERRLSVPELVRIAEALDQPLANFVNDAPPAVVSRRSDPALAHGSSSQLDSELQLFESDIRALLRMRLLSAAAPPVGGRTPRSHVMAERMANALREKLGLGSAPIDDLGAVAERLGLYTYAAPLGLDGPDGGCVTSPGDGASVAGVAVINGEAPSGRRRMTLAHELGHWLTGDAYDSAASPEAEKVLSSFAIYFLAPRAGVAALWRDLSDEPLRHRCLSLAAHFRISWSALLGQLRNLDHISQSEFAMLSKAEPRSGDYVRLGLWWPEDLHAPYVSPMVAQAVVDGYVTGRLTQERALSILRGTLGVDDLPQVEELSLDDLRPAFLGHGA